MRLSKIKIDVVLCFFLFCWCWFDIGSLIFVVWRGGLVDVFWGLLSVYGSCVFLVFVLVLLVLVLLVCGDVWVVLVWFWLYGGMVFFCVEVLIGLVVGVLGGMGVWVFLVNMRIKKVIMIVRLFICFLRFEFWLVMGGIWLGVFGLLICWGVVVVLMRLLVGWCLLMVCFVVEVLIIKLVDEWVKFMFLGLVMIEVVSEVMSLMRLFSLIFRDVLLFVLGMLVLGVLGKFILCVFLIVWLVFLLLGVISCIVGFVWLLVGSLWCMEFVLWVLEWGCCFWCFWVLKLVRYRIMFIWEGVRCKSWVGNECDDVLKLEERGGKRKYLRKED